ncbi:hypothetical protein SmJEL517_g05451 [Synchytrium microbalum]|uniref:Uncharacterized protein n=1 Tax=Synchytrium microbalum TaxID=1806994 RepID=A0A507BNV9_9FUNG|nr:uncharacterized protein SmJEL517_g05451 [Synchytrium microbalum]TPX31117.1 hypothetical protein SmJEL517_g05451 [Synchytrium microbalum]
MRPDAHQQQASRRWNKAHPEGRGGSTTGRGGRGRGAPKSRASSSNVAPNTTNSEEIDHQEDGDDVDLDNEEGLGQKSFSRRKIESNEYRFVEVVEVDIDGRPVPVEPDLEEEASKKVMAEVRESLKTKDNFQELKLNEDVDIGKLANSLKQAAPVKKKLDLSKFAKAPAS